MFLFSLLFVHHFDSSGELYFQQVKHTESNVFTAYSESSSLTITNFIHIISVDSDDVVKKSTTPNPNPNDASHWTTLSGKEINQILFNTGPISVLVIPRTTHSVLIRGGYTRPDLCPDGTLLSLQTSFDLSSRLNKPEIQYPYTFCVIFLHYESRVEIKNTLLETDSLKYETSKNVFTEVAHGASINADSSLYPLYLVINLQNEGQRSMSLSISGATPPEGVPLDIFEGEPDDVSIITPSRTKYVPTKYIGTPPPTPAESWDGRWLDPSNVIIRGEEIPEIHETYPPLQTDYVKAEVPKVKKIVTFSTGSIIIVVVVALTIINILRTYNRIQRVKGEFEGSAVESDLDLSSEFYLESYSSTVN